MLKKVITPMVSVLALAATVSAASAENTIRMFTSGPSTVWTSSNPSHVTGFANSMLEAFGSNVPLYNAAPFKVAPTPTVKVVPGFHYSPFPIPRPIFAKPVVIEVEEPVVVEQPIVVAVAEPDLDAEVVVVEPVKLSFNCVVKGEPKELPHDIFISNPYGFTTADGLEVAYNAPLGIAGLVVLPALEPGAGVYVRDAVKGGMAPGVECAAVEQ